jgi:hypothetical protein
MYLFNKSLTFVALLTSPVQKVGDFEAIAVTAALCGTGQENVVTLYEIVKNGATDTWEEKPMGAWRILSSEGENVYHLSGPQVNLLLLKEPSHANP